MPPRSSPPPSLTVFPAATARTAPQLTPAPFSSSRVLRSLRCLQAPCAGPDPPTPAARPQLAVARRPAAVHQHPPRRARPRGRRLLGHLHPALVSRPKDTGLRRHCRPAEPRRWVPDRRNWWEGCLHRAAGRRDRQHTPSAGGRGWQGAPTPDPRPAQDAIPQGPPGEVRRQ